MAASLDIPSASRHDADTFSTASSDYRGYALYQLFADAVLVVHLMFIAFVLGGGLLALWRPRIAWFHLPAAAWGALIEIMNWTCPLTPLENYFLKLAGDTSYQVDFITRYLLPLIYPACLTPMIQGLLGGFVIVLNCVIYAGVVIKAKKRRLDSAINTHITR
jgi:hypothetical protein